MWIKIEHLKKYVKDEWTMFVVKAFNVQIPDTNGTYTTDPYCTWWEEGHSLKEFPRWPHPFKPTHFCLLPVERER